MVSREPEVSRAKLAILLTPRERERERPCSGELALLHRGSSGSKGPRFSVGLIHGGLGDALALCKG